MSAQFQFLQNETQFKAVLQHAGSVTFLNSQNQVLLTVTHKFEFLGTCDAEPRYIAHHHELGDVIQTHRVKVEKCCICCPTSVDFGIFAGQEHLGSFRYPSRVQSGHMYVNVFTPTELLDADGNFYLKYCKTTSNVFDAKSLKENESDIRTQTLITEGPNLVATLDTRSQGQPGVLPWNHSATISVSPQLPVPTKLCLMMNAAMLLFDFWRRERQNRS
ncbi:Oidioi.mRNA.OKI2018_I69.chr1.g3740.t1.cds [Oikopleura dioica]|uniref:Oidioi.mRNA.OKI2018_I69.chr1.g3740.t1.cds n=1 Tax=Oikopleura dioica TaxID=34765 RepID=A0ABN7SV55_OIKDI|nr:Oidioi.mRNA.OKI2018_I69.chr1.g3740.t1.cds [Oikopleura dioica]